MHVAVHLSKAGLAHPESPARGCLACSPQGACAWHAGCVYENSHTPNKTLASPCYGACRQLDVGFIDSAHYCTEAAATLLSPKVYKATNLSTMVTEGYYELKEVDGKRSTAPLGHEQPLAYQVWTPRARAGRCRVHVGPSSERTCSSACALCKGLSERPCIVGMPASCL